MALVEDATGSGGSATAYFPAPPPTPFGQDGRPEKQQSIYEGCKDTFRKYVYRICNLLRHF